MPNSNHLERREAIRQKLLQGPVATQGSLVAALARDGFDATQSSVSRDLKELGAIKTAAGYELRANSAGDDQLNAVAGLLRDIKAAGPNLLVIKTEIGAAQRVALAFVRSNWPEVIGNIGGDDTVFVATPSGTAQKNIISRIDRSARS